MLVFFGAIAMAFFLRRQELARVEIDSRAAATEVKLQLADFTNERVALTRRLGRRLETLLPYSFGDAVFDIDAFTILKDYQDVMLIQRFDIALRETNVLAQPTIEPPQQEKIRLDLIDRARLDAAIEAWSSTNNRQTLVLQGSEGFRAVAPLRNENNYTGSVSLYHSFTPFFRRFAAVRRPLDFRVAISDENNSFLFGENFLALPLQYVTTPVEIGGLRLRIHVAPTASALRTRLTWLPWVVGVCGMLICGYMIWIYRIGRALRAAHLDLEKKVLDRTRQLTRSNEDLERFAFACSHDLQEPLRKISNFASLLEIKSQGALGDEGHAIVEKIIRSCGWLQAMIRDLLMFSRMGHGAKTDEAVDVAKVLDEILADMELLIHEKSGSITWGDMPVVEANKALLRQLFQNLIANAFKYAGNNPPTVVISCEWEEQQYTFSVRDNGIGIAPEYHDQIFSLFTRLHTKQDYEGSGIGLATCKKIVDKFGGKIWVESMTGEGATFHFTLPNRRVAQGRSSRRTNSGFARKTD